MLMCVVVTICFQHTLNVINEIGIVTNKVTIRRFEFFYNKLIHNLFLQYFTQKLLISKRGH